MTEFVRVGDEVLRPATASTEAMKQLLEHLEASGFEGAPRVVGSEPDTNYHRQRESNITPPPNPGGPRDCARPGEVHLGWHSGRR